MTVYVFDADGYFTGVLEGMAAPENSTKLPPVYIPGQRPRFVNGAWLTGAKLIGPVEFKLLFTPGERVAIKTSADPVVQDIYDVLNDPRLKVVDLALQSTHDSLRYLEHQKLIAVGRADEILSGGSFAVKGAA